MKISRYRTQLWFILFVVGFILGILYENFTYEEYSDSATIFDTYFLQQFAETEIVVEDYMKYIICQRVPPLILICILGSLKWKKGLVRLVIGWTGFLLGVLTASSIIWQGVRGFLFCMGILFPHMIFYSLSYAMILWYFYSYPEWKWNIKKTIVTGLSFVIGIVCETYVTPLLLSMVVKLF